MPKCNQCGHEWENPAKRDLKDGIKVLIHPIKNIKDSFKKKKFPEDCKRDCKKCEV